MRMCKLARRKHRDRKVSRETQFAKHVHTSDYRGFTHSHDHTEIRKLRGWIWDVLAESKHKVSKVMKSNDSNEPECMLIGDGFFLTKDKTPVNASWAGHIEMKKEGEEWKLSSYRVWSQNE
jgi:hypothetical protein